MIIPIGDEPNPEGRPVVTWALLGLNALVFLLSYLQLSKVAAHQVADPAVFAHYLETMARELQINPRALALTTTGYDLFIFEWGFRPGEPSMATLLSSMFMHADWKHLLGNLLILFIFGDNVEHRLGPRIYLLAYLGMGVCATLFFSVFSMGSNIPLVGASGAISGVLGMYFLWFPLNRVKVFIWFFWFIQVHYLPARIVLGIYLFIDNVLPFLFGGRGGGVAHGAHIGGFVAGLLAAQAIHKFNLFRFRESGAASVWGRSADAVHLDDFRSALHEKSWDDLVSAWGKLSSQEMASIDDWEWLEAADGLTEDGRFETALGILQRFIATRYHSSLLALAHLRAGLIQLRGLHRYPAAYQHLLAVLDLEPPVDVAQTARTALEEVEKHRRETTWS